MSATRDGLTIKQQDYVAGARWHVVCHPDIVGGICGEYVEPGDETNARRRLLRRARSLLREWDSEEES